MIESRPKDITPVRRRGPTKVLKISFWLSGSQNLKYHTGPFDPTPIEAVVGQPITITDPTGQGKNELVVGKVLTTKYVNGEVRATAELDIPVDIFERLFNTRYNAGPNDVPVAGSRT